MKWFDALPTMQAVISVGACAGYLYAGMWAKALYWFSGALITVAVIWM